MQEGHTSLLALFRSRASGGKMRQLGRDQRGFLGLSIPLIILAILGVLIFSWLSSINWGFLLVVMMVVVLGLMVYGAVFKGIDFKYVVIVALLCLALAMILTITIPVILGLLFVGFAMWKLTPAKQPALFVMMVGVGLVLVVIGSKLAVESLGILP
jgi:hypothetical protein